MKITHYQALGLSYATLVDRERGILEGLRPLAAQSAQRLNDQQLLAAYRQLTLQLARQANSPAALHGQLYQRLAQQLLVVPDWDASVAFGSAAAQWPIYEDAPGALQYLSKFYRLVLIAPRHGIDIESLTRRLPVAFDAVVEPADDDWRPALAQALQEIEVQRMGMLPVRSSEPDDPWNSLVDFPICTLRRAQSTPWNLTHSALDAKRCEYASLADMAHAHQWALRA
ncbi:hypothetical protein OSW16_20685 [Pseudomonas putida]|uniref:hypothetical protein n=1 Tax=Pseudomonas TaxID=286 RepID=UPI00226E3A21|nr:hypothetical protein [Pseudomonas putida]WAB96935.1 hypothetical protein OSW16_20685 [Pseudomonas putida]